MITQRDGSLNIALARDSRTLAAASKRDSSSMKTLAAMTALFLPGTFVASFFAMPVFNWAAFRNA
jgi:Mg2+ and Co2+ transporter CorA